MVADRKHGRLAVALLSGVAGVILLNGLLAGVHQDWARMALYLSAFILNVSIVTGVVVILTVDRCLKRIADRLGNTNGVVRAPHQETANVLGLVMVICVPILLLLSWFAGLRQQAFVLGICMTVCAFVIFVGMGMMMALAMLARFERLEQIVLGKTGTKPGDSLSKTGASQGQP